MPTFKQFIKRKLITRFALVIGIVGICAITLGIAGGITLGKQETAHTATLNTAPTSTSTQQAPSSTTPATQGSSVTLNSKSSSNSSQSNADATAKANVEDMQYKQEMNCINIDNKMAKGLESEIDTLTNQAYDQRDQIQSQHLSEDETNKEIASVYAEYNGYIESYYNNYISTDKGYGCTPTYPSDLPLL